MASKPSNCILDPILTKLLKELLPVLGPPMLNIINGFLSTGCVPNSLKVAVIKPLLKKPNDTENIKNYRPISNLPFLSKLFEKAVAQFHLCLSPFLSLSFSFSFSSPGGPEPEDHASGLPGLMTPCCPQSTWPCCCSSFNCSACGYGTLTCSPTCYFVPDLLF